MISISLSVVTETVSCTRRYVQWSRVTYHISQSQFQNKRLLPRCLPMRSRASIRPLLLISTLPLQLPLCLLLRLRAVRRRSWHVATIPVLTSGGLTVTIKRCL